MMKTLKIFLVIIVTSILSNCGFIRNIYNVPLGYVSVIGFNGFRLLNFERSIACYYKLNNEFPKDESRFKDFTDTTDFSKYNNLVFSKLERTYLTNNSLKYNFRLKPYQETTKSDSSKFFIDSMRVYEFEGNLIFSDSLMSQKIDSLIIVMEVTSLNATIFIEEDSINYNNESAEVFLKQDKSFSYKISVEKSCLK